MQIAAGSAGDDSRKMNAVDVGRIASEASLDDIERWCGPCVPGFDAATAETAVRAQLSGK